LLPFPCLISRKSAAVAMLKLQQNSIQAMSPTPLSPCKFMPAFYPVARRTQKVVHGKAADQSNALEDISYLWPGLYGEV